MTSTATELQYNGLRCGRRTATLVLGLALGLIMLACGNVTSFAQPSCGTGPSDWCPAPSSDPCGRHRNAAECKADPACYGMPYRGESVVRCNFDARGFGTNCPTVGCTSTALRK